LMFCSSTNLILCSRKILVIFCFHSFFISQVKSSFLLELLYINEKQTRSSGFQEIIAMPCWMLNTLLDWQWCFEPSIKVISQMDKDLRLEESALHFHSSFYKPTTIDWIKYEVRLGYTTCIGLHQNWISAFW
jgi:hypothetical protein